MTDTRDGLAAVVAASGAGEGIRETLQPVETGDLFAPHAGDEALPIATRRPAGRPKGSGNRRTTDVAEYLVRRHGDPLEGLLAIGMGSLLDTARELAEVIAAMKAEGLPIAVKDSMTLGVDLGELLKLKAKCLEAALPYIHARRAPTDEKGSTVVPILNVQTFVGAPGQSGSGVSAEDMIDITPNQTANP